MENVIKKNPTCVFENLNHRHQELLDKLSELNDRLYNSTVLLCGEYPLKEQESVERDSYESHINSYVNQLDYMQSTLSYMLNHIEMLENIVLK